MEYAPFYVLPLWVVGLIFIIILTITLEAGFRVGLIRRAHWKDADSGGGAVVLILNVRVSHTPPTAPLILNDYVIILFSKCI